MRTRRTIQQLVLALTLALPLTLHRLARADEPAPAQQTSPAKALAAAGKADAADRWISGAATLDAARADLANAATRGDPLALPYMYRLLNLSRLVERPEDVDQVFELLGTVEALDPLSRVHAEYLASRALWRQGKLAQAREKAATLGLITDVYLLGPFENSAGVGHEEAYPPEVAIDLDEPLRGKDHEISWRRLSGVSAYGALELSSLMHPSEAVTAYTIVAIHADRQTKAALRVGATDRVKAFLDGKLVLESSTIRRAELDQHVAGVWLEKGWSLLMIKTSWDGSVGRLLLRLSTPEGAPLKGVRVSAAPADLKQAISKPTSAAKERPRFNVVSVESAVDRAVERSSGAKRAEFLALRSDLYSMLHLFDEKRLPTPPQSDLEQAITLAPNVPMHRFFYAHRMEEADPTVAREQLKEALRADPTHVPSLFKSARMAEGVGQELAARSLYAKALAHDPTYLPAQVALASIRFGNRWEQARAMKDLETALSAKSSAYLLSQISDRKWGIGDRLAAVDLATKALAIDRADERSRAHLIRAAVDRGDLKQALAELDRAIAQRPWQLVHRLQRARLLVAIEQSHEAGLRYLGEVAKVFADAPEVFDLAAELALFSNDKALATKHLVRSIALDPQRPDVRKHNAILSGTKSELEDRYTVDVMELAKLPVTKEEKTWGAVFLADRTAVRLFPSGQATKFRQTVLRIYNENLKDALRSDQIPYSPTREAVEILSAERIRPSGEIEKARRISDHGPGGKVMGMYIDQRWKAIVFDDLERGDLVHIRYRIDSVGQNIFGGFFGDTAPLMARVPKKNVQYVALAPESRPLYAKAVRVPEPVVTNENGTQKTVWDLDSIPALEMEPFSPAYSDIGAMVSVSTYRTWDELGAWYSRLYREQLVLDEAARSAAKKAIRGAKTDAEKITRLYNYVVKNTRYVGIELGIHGWKPYKAAEVHRRRYGDCKDKATLLAALLMDNGIDAGVTLLRTRDRGDFPKDHASMWAFNHAITYVPKADLFLDGTAEYSGSKELPDVDQGAFALVVYPDGRTELKRPPTSKPRDNLNSSTYKATLSKNGSLVLVGTERFAGARASSLRREHQEEQTRKQHIEKQMNEILPGARVTKLEFSDLDNLEASVSYDYTTEVDRYGTVEADRVVIPVTLFQHRVSDAYGSLASRKHPLHLDYAWATNNRVEYVLEKGLRLTELPSNIDIDSEYISLTQKVERTPTGFVTDDTVTLKKNVIPVEAYPAFREACVKIDQALARKAVLAK